MPTIRGAMERLKNTLRFGRFDRRSVFSHIFHDRYWGDNESVSGMGSRLSQTENIRVQLPILFDKYRVKTLFDAPCGDLNWMRSILERANVDYIGGDIVPEVVALALRNSPNPRFDFRLFDIVADPFPKADMWLCRDVLFHFSFTNIWKTFDNFCRSDIPLMLVTSHTDPTLVNRNVVTGDFRCLSLFKSPFSLASSMILDRFVDYADPSPPREMIVIRREELAAHIKARDR